MEKVSLIVEGKEDVRFLEDFIKFHFGKKISNNAFIIIEGKSETIKQSASLIQISSSKPNKNVVIFDADDHDYQSTLEKIKKVEVYLELKFDSIFLFPDNQSQGNLESLLKSSVTKGNEGLFDCIENYAACKCALKLKKPRAIGEKEKIVIYHGSFEGSGSAQGTKREYLDSEIWDLNAPSLNQLKSFLSPFFQ
jgi:5S rRNA maturation endonuclease (ribonuclease M5)